MQWLFLHWEGEPPPQTAGLKLSLMGQTPSASGLSAIR